MVTFASNDNRWRPCTLRAKSAKGANMRSQPSTMAAIVKTLPANIDHQAKSIAWEKLTDSERSAVTDGYIWYPILQADGVSWVRNDAATVNITSTPLDQFDREAIRIILAKIKPLLQDIFTLVNALEESIQEE